MAIIGHGSTLAHGVGSGSVVVSQCKKITMPDWSITKVDTTNLDSPDSCHESIPGLLDMGVCSADVQFTSGANYLALATLASARTVTTWEVATPSNEVTATFTGFISKFGGLVLEPESDAIFSIEIQPTGKVGVA